jgi:hypothetical protein
VGVIIGTRAEHKSHPRTSTASRRGEINQQTALDRHG